LSRVITQFTDDDFDYYITNFNPEWMLKMGTAKGVMELLKVIMKRPNLKAIVSGLLS
jgi:hypothetical protein